MYKTYLRKFKRINAYLKKVVYGSDLILRTGLVVVPIAQDISLILASQLTSLLVTLGIYTARRTAYVSAMFLGGLIGILF